MLLMILFNFNLSFSVPMKLKYCSSTWLSCMVTKHPSDSDRTEDEAFFQKSDNVGKDQKGESRLSNPGYLYGSSIVF